MQRDKLKRLKCQLKSAMYMEHRAFCSAAIYDFSSDLVHINLLDTILLFMLQLKVWPIVALWLMVF